MTTPRLSLGTQLALMRHAQPAPTRPRLTLYTQPPTITQAACPAHEEDDYLMRGTVIEEPYLDEIGRACFTAVSHRGMRLESGVAAPGERAGVLERLWAAVDRSSEKPPLKLLSCAEA